MPFVISLLPAPQLSFARFAIIGHTAAALGFQEPISSQEFSLVPLVTRRKLEVILAQKPGNVREKLCALKPDLDNLLLWDHTIRHSDVSGSFGPMC